MEKIFKTIGLYNPKGGVGKSSILASLAFELSKHGKTLIFDGDPQGSLSYILLDKNYERYFEEEKDLLHLFRDETTVKEAAITAREKADEFKGLDIIVPGDKKNFRAYISSIYQTEGPDKSIRQIFDEAKEEGYEYVLYDLPGHLGQYEKTILAWLTDIMPITEAEDLAKAELDSLLKELKKIQIQFNGNGKINSNLIINKVVKDNKVHEYFLQVFDKQLPFFNKFIFTQTKIISSSISQHLTVQEYSRNCKTAKVLEDLAKTFIPENNKEKGE